MNSWRISPQFQKNKQLPLWRSPINSLLQKTSPSFMKLLLDENLPKRLKQDFPSHDVYTIRDMGWNGIKNGELMQLMLDHNFNALLTFDKNLQYQQNFRKFT